MPQVTFPARCAVAVIAGEHLMSQVYPAAVPIEAFLDDIVELFDAELKRRGLSGLENVAYELHRANGTRLDITRSLDELGVEDGAAIMLVPAAEGDSFEPQYESLSTGLARVGRKLFDPVTPDTAAHTGIAILAMIVTTIFGLAVDARAHTDSLAPALSAAAVGMMCAGGAASVLRWWPGRAELLDGAAWLSVPLLAVGAGFAAPGPLGAPHVFIATLAAAVLSVAVVMLTGRGTTAAAAVVSLCAMAWLAATVRMWWAVPSQWLGMFALIELLVLITMAPTLALWAARIRPPHFGSITGRDLFRRGDGLPTDSVAPVAEDTGDDQAPDGTPSGSALEADARRANGAMTGICVATAVALPIAVWTTLMPGGTRGMAAAALAALFVVIFVSRGRAFADKRQAVALVCGAAAAVCAAVIRYALHTSPGSSVGLIWGTVVLIGFAAAVLVSALLVPMTRFTPLVRMVAEWVELAAIVAAFPLAAWVGGLFTWVRMR